MDNLSEQKMDDILEQKMQNLTSVEEIWYIHSIDITSLCYITDEQIDSCLKSIKKIGKEPKCTRNVKVSGFIGKYPDSQYFLADDSNVGYYCRFECYSQLSISEFWHSFIWHEIKNELKDIMDYKACIGCNENLNADIIGTIQCLQEQEKKEKKKDL